MFRDTYLLDFLDLTEPHSERDLQGGLVGDMRRFLQALGPDFSFVVALHGSVYSKDAELFHIGNIQAVAAPFDGVHGKGHEAVRLGGVREAVNDGWKAEQPPIRKGPVRQNALKRTGARRASAAGGQNMRMFETDLRQAPLCLGQMLAYRPTGEGPPASKLFSDGVKLHRH